MDNREFIEEENDYEDFKNYITKVFNNYIKNLKLLEL
jgi:hypothetical protein